MESICRSLSVSRLEAGAVIPGRGAVHATGRDRGFYPPHRRMVTSSSTAASANHRPEAGRWTTMCENEHVQSQPRRVNRTKCANASAARFRGGVLPSDVAGAKISTPSAAPGGSLAKHKGQTKQLCPARSQEMASRHLDRRGWPLCLRVAMSSRRDRHAVRHHG